MAADTPAQAVASGARGTKKCTLTTHALAVSVLDHPDQAVDAGTGYFSGKGSTVADDEACILGNDVGDFPDSVAKCNAIVDADRRTPALAQ